MSKEDYYEAKDGKEEEKGTFSWLPEGCRALAGK